MLIDFHTHIFPDKVAAAALESLKQGILDIEGTHAVSYTDATAAGLENSMAESGVDISVVVPVATKAKQMNSINAFSLKTQKKTMIFFGAFHPECEDIEGELEKIKNNGFKGIKIHPEFQRLYIDEPRSVKIFKTAEKLGMYVLIHSGADIGLPPPVHCDPQRLKNLLGEVSGKYIIAAHLGAFRMWDSVEKYLVGTHVKFDTAFVKDFISAEQYKRIIKNHGADKILFGSDSPWENPVDTLAALKKLGLTDDELELITYKNAQNLLKI